MLDNVLPGSWACSLGTLSIRTGPPSAERALGVDVQNGRIASPRIVVVRGHGCCRRQSGTPTRHAGAARRSCLKYPHMYGTSTVQLSAVRYGRRPQNDNTAGHRSGCTSASTRPVARVRKSTSSSLVAGPICASPWEGQATLLQATWRAWRCRRIRRAHSPKPRIGVGAAAITFEVHRSVSHQVEACCRTTTAAQGGGRTERHKRRAAAASLAWPVPGCAGTRAPGRPCRSVHTRDEVVASSARTGRCSTDWCRRRWCALCGAEARSGVTPLAPLSQLDRLRRRFSPPRRGAHHGVEEEEVLCASVSCKSPAASSCHLFALLRFAAERPRFRRGGKRERRGRWKPSLQTLRYLPQDGPLLSLPGGRLGVENITG